MEADLDTDDDEVFLIANAQAQPTLAECPHCGHIPDNVFIVDPDDLDEDDEDEKSPDPFRKSEDWWKQG